MSAYSSYATNDFFANHQAQQALSHLPQQTLTHQDPMIFHPAPTYYAPNPELIGYPPAHQDTATAFHFYQPNAQPTWPDSQFDINYSQINPPTSFDYAGLGTGVASSATNGLKHWSGIDQFATAPLLSSTTVGTNEMLLTNFQSVANEVASANIVLSSLDRNETSSANIVRDVQKTRNLQHQHSSQSLTHQQTVVSNDSSLSDGSKCEAKTLTRPQRALNARQLQIQNPSAKVFTCTQCNRQYCRKSTLKAHMKQHNGGERQFVCECCGKTFTQAANLTAHQRVHTGEKPFACSICLRPFSQSSSLVTHKRTHTGERPYPCPHCTKSFTDSSTLTKHMRTHTGIKPYSCHLCMMRFSQSGNLHRHMKTHRGYNPDN